MRVLHLITWLNRGGIESWLLSMLGEIDRADCEMDICCKGPNPGTLVAEAQAFGATVWHCPLGPDHIRFAYRLRAILKEGQYDLLHNHLGAYSGFPVWVARRARIPVITSYHNTHFAPQTWTKLFGLRQLRALYSATSVRYALRYSDLVTGCSEGVIRSLDPTGKLLGRRSRVLYYGVALPEQASEMQRTELRKSLGWPTDTPVILHVGRFCEQKNHKGVILVFEQVVERLPEARLLLVGDGPLRPPVEKLIADREMTGLVRLLGIRDNVPTLMSQCDVFLFPSLYEGFGLVALEANAAGLPVVGSRIPGLTEAVEDGETAILHDPTALQQMAESVIELITNREHAREMGEAGRLRAREHFSVAVAARNLLEVYHEVLS